MLAGGVAVVTGGGRGIGFAIATVLAGAGATVLVTGRDAARLAAAADAAQAALGRAALRPVEADVTSEADVARVFARAAELGPLRVLVCNAGINPQRRLGIAEMALADWDAVLATNLRGAFLCCRAALPLLRAAGSARIVMVNSIAGLVTPDRNSPAYRASKHALTSLATTLAKDLADTAVRVSSVMPGTVATDMTRGGAAATGAVLDPRDVAEAVMFLVTRPDEVVVPEIVISPRSEIAGGSSPYR